MKKGIWISVVGVHLALVAVMALSFPLSSSKRKKKALVVKTITPNTVATSVQSTPSPAVSTAKEKSTPISPTPKPVAPIKTAPQKKEKTSPQAPPKKAAPKKIVSAPKPESAPKIPKKLLQELEESIAKIDGKREKLASQKKLDPPRSIAPPPPKLGDEEEFIPVSTEEMSYQETLVSYLHQALNLPEHGEVKIELTLRKDGTVAGLIVLKTESEKNKAYLQKSLTHLKFPISEGMFSNKNQQTFILTFCNEL